VLVWSRTRPLKAAHAAGTLEVAPNPTPGTLESAPKPAVE
jgi:hypothetical protein